MGVPHRGENGYRSIFADAGGELVGKFHVLTVREDGRTSSVIWKMLNVALSAPSMI